MGVIMTTEGITAPSDSSGHIGGFSAKVRVSRAMAFLAGCGLEGGRESDCVGGWSRGSASLLSTRRPQATCGVSTGERARTTTHVRVSPGLPGKAEITEGRGSAASKCWSAESMEWQRYRSEISSVMCTR